LIGRIRFRERFYCSVPECFWRSRRSPCLWITLAAPYFRRSPPAPIATDASFSAVGAIMPAAFSGRV